MRYSRTVWQVCQASHYLVFIGFIGRLCKYLISTYYKIDIFKHVMSTMISKTLLKLRRLFNFLICLILFCIELWFGFVAVVSWWAAGYRAMWRHVRWRHRQGGEKERQHLPTSKTRWRTESCLRLTVKLATNRIHTCRISSSSAAAAAQLHHSRRR